MNIHRPVGMVAAIAAILLLAMACGDSSSADKSSTVEKGADKAFRWGVIFAPSPRTVKIGGGADYCEGDPRPRIARPDIEYRGNKAVYIKLELKSPDRPKSKKLCLDSELLVTRKITLRRDLSDVKLYDSGVEPPELRWPR